MQKPVPTGEPRWIPERHHEYSTDSRHPDRRLAERVLRRRRPPSRRHRCGSRGEIVTLVDAENAGFLQAGDRRCRHRWRTALARSLIWDETRTVRVFPQLGGRVSGIAVDVGNAVKSGQTLAVLQSADYGLAQSDARRAAAPTGASPSRHASATGCSARPAWFTRRTAAGRGRAVRAPGRSGAHQPAAGPDWVATAMAGLRPQGAVGGHGCRTQHQSGDGIPRQARAGAPMFVITDPTALWFSARCRRGRSRH